MEKENRVNSSLTLTIIINKPLSEVWQHWTNPRSITQWNIPFDNWHCPKAENNVCDGGKFNFRMESKDGLQGFNYSGVYDQIIPLRHIESTGDDGRKTVTEFSAINNRTIIRETFEPDPEVPINEQQHFTNAVLNRFKAFAESR